MSRAFVPTCLWTMSVLLASATASGATRSSDTDGRQPGNAAPVHYEVDGLSGADADKTAYAVEDGADPETSGRAVSAQAGAVNLRFATPEDTRDYVQLVSRANALSMPDAHSVARDFIRSQLGIDGDKYVVAHFATPEDRRQGRPDHSRSLTQAVMEAFPDHSRHTWFALAADTVGGIFGGGSGSPGIVTLGEHLIQSGSLKNTLAEIGNFVWSRTGPGYIYETFFAKGNVVETAKEDYRSIDEAFGVYAAGGFTAKHETSIRLSSVIEKFKVPGAFSELPYVKTLHAAMDDYWRSHGADWTVLARHQFVLRAKWARQSGVLDEAQYRLVMRGGAPRVPLTGPVTMAQLRAGGKEPGTTIRRFDINGYTSSDLVRFVAADGSEVMYIPGHDPAFVTAASESALRQWVLAQSKNSRTLELLLSHFSLHDSQDGVFWTGVKHGLENIGDGRWKADGKAVDHTNATIDGDVFEDMRAALERRSRSDARMQSSSAGEAWRTTLNRVASLLSPLGFLRPLAIPVQVTLGVLQTGTGIEKGLDGRTWDERKSGWEEAGLTVVTNTIFGGAFGGGEQRAVDLTRETPERPFMATPQRVNGKIGYPMGPIRAPRLPAESSIRLFVKDDRGRLGIWGPAQLEQASYVRVPAGVPDVEIDGVIGVGKKQYVKLQGGKVVRVLPATDGWRIRSKDGTFGPVVRRQRDGLWAIEFNDYNFLKGSVLADRGGVQYTSNGEVLQRAAGILEQFGSSEEAVLTSGQKGQAGPLEVLAIAHQILDTLPDRLRGVNNRRWTPWEAELLMPTLAKAVNRPIAMYERDGAFRFGVRADGTECGPNDVPATAIRVSPNGGEYVLLGGTGPSSVTPEPFINLVATQVGQAFLTQGSARAFRSGLASELEAGAMGPELEHVHRRWVGPLVRDGETWHTLESLSHLRHTLLYRTGLTAPQEAMLRKADAAWRETAPLVEARPDIDAVVARLKQADSPFLWLDTPYLEKMFAQVAAEYDALLPRAFQHLLVENPAILAYPDQAADAWLQGGRHYVRLRHLDGRTQVVETSAPEADGSRQILLPGDPLLRGSGRRVVGIQGKWFPEASLRDGLAPMRPLNDTAWLANVAPRQLASSAPVAASVEALMASIPQPLRRILGAGLPSARIGQHGIVEMDVQNPVTGRSMLFRTYRDIAGNPVPHVRWAMPLPHDTISEYPPDVHLNVPVPDGLAPLSGGAPVDRQGYEGLLHGEQPISAFVEAGYGGRHVKVLVETRRLRGMLREDDTLAVVGTTGDHVFGLVMPVGFDSVAMATSREPLPWTFQNLPIGTVVVDSMFDIRARVEDYAAAVRVKAAEWQAQGIAMKRIGSQGLEVRESPLSFVDRMLASPVRINLWNPAKDPVSEVAYVRFVRTLYTKGITVNRAGIDWLETRKARRDYLSYFAPPYDIMPTGYVPLADDVPGMRLHQLAQTALEAMEQSQ